MSDPTVDDVMMMEIDNDMTEVFQSWFETCRLAGLSLDEQDEKIVFMHLRMAFVHGRRIGREDMQPLIEEHANDLRMIAQALREL